MLNQQSKVQEGQWVRQGGRLMELIVQLVWVYSKRKLACHMMLQVLELQGKHLIKWLGQQVLVIYQKDLKIQDLFSITPSILLTGLVASYQKRTNIVFKAHEQKFLQSQNHQDLALTNHHHQELKPFLSRKLLIQWPL